MDKTKKEKTTVTRPHGVLDMEINVAYMMAMGLERMLNDIERRLNEVGAGFAHDKKMRFRNIINAIKVVKSNADLMDQIDYANAFKDNPSQWEGYLENGLWIDRLMLLICDRIAANPEAYDTIPKRLRARKSAGIVTEKDLERFYLQKYKG